MWRILRVDGLKGGEGGVCTEGMERATAWCVWGSFSLWCACGMGWEGLQRPGPGGPFVACGGGCRGAGLGEVRTVAAGVLSTR